jgi:hypothetical protein
MRTCQSYPRRVYNLSHSAEENAENVLVVRSAALAERYNEYVDGLVTRYRARG